MMTCNRLRVAASRSVNRISLHELMEPQRRVGSEKRTLFRAQPKSTPDDDMMERCRSFVGMLCCSERVENEM
jgi:hypothetical protein